jgi:Cytochrome C oxidase, cbb3-type, subunit III
VYPSRLTRKGTQKFDETNHLRIRNNHRRFFWSGVWADAGALWAQNCASCHGKDGRGNTTVGKKLGVKDYTKEQGFSDAEAANVIKNGKGKMKGYKDKLSDADVKACRVRSCFEEITG